MRGVHKLLVGMIVGYSTRLQQIHSSKSHFQSAQVVIPITSFLYFQASLPRVTSS